MIETLIRILGAIVGLGVLLIAALELALGLGRREGLDTVSIVVFFFNGTIFLVFGLVGRARLQRLGARLMGKNVGGDRSEDQTRIRK